MFIEIRTHTKSTLLDGTHAQDVKAMVIRQ
jgi:hypothetical protein